MEEAKNGTTAVADDSDVSSVEKVTISVLEKLMMEI